MKKLCLTVLFSLQQKENRKQSYGEEKDFDLKRGRLY